MRVFPLEFIDSAWFDDIKKEINSVRDELEGVQIMYENVAVFLDNNETDKKKINEELKLLDNRMKENEITIEKKLAIITGNLDKLIVGMTKLNDEILNQNRVFGAYKVEHKLKHEEHVSLLDRIFSKN